MSKPLPLLTRLELLVMRALWNAGPEPLTIRAVVDRINAGRRKTFAYTTIQTIVMILKKKGVVKAVDLRGKAHLYSPRLSRNVATSSLVGEFLERMFEGRAEPLLAHLLEQKTFDRDELESLRNMIDQQLGDSKEPRS